MADNIAITAGTGTTVATDDVSGVHYQRVKRAVGAADTAAYDVLTKVSANFTCPNNTSHTANDNISDNSTAGSVTKMSFSVAAGAGTIRRIRIKKSNESVVTPTIRLFLWDTTFTVASGDDAAFSQPLTDCIGFVDVPVTTAGSDDGVGWANCDIPFAAGTLYGLLQTLTTFTVGASEVFTVDIWYLPG
jgi:hypothetical protein